MPKSTLLAPLFGALAGYAGATILGVHDGLVVFLAAVICMIAVGVAALVVSRRRRTGV
ncbi:MAG: hypothetical protein HYW57_00705 [Ignavibacteriales bacterium]|nr:hypothetical protein [Ignavibacteriales bacterium]